ncbi:hypothetical protein [Sphingomonas faeni]|uniref:hypothetical protein n=1 Tax=Sphingomonas faeni TaxID=185950 RepID=UPI0020C789AB|nr:hypothetical protein [Sphingomonas faeni]MCP8892961.1 hypothetical protein [Sphingomonas faeni]
MAKMWREFPTLGKLAGGAQHAKSRKPLQLLDFQNWHDRCNAGGNPPNSGTNQPQRGPTMFNTNIARTVAATLCTIVVSATCVLGAVGPAIATNAAPVAVHTAIVA